MVAEDKAGHSPSRSLLRKERRTGRFPGDFQAGSGQQHADESAFWLHPGSPAWEMSPSVVL